METRVWDAFKTDPYVLAGYGDNALTLAKALLKLAKEFSKDPSALTLHVYATGEGDEFHFEGSLYVDP